MAWAAVRGHFRIDQLLLLQQAQIALKIEHQNSDQHQHASQQRIEKELDGCIFPPRPPQTPIKKYIGNSITSQKT